MMTLDRWKGIIDQVHYDSFNEEQICQIRKVSKWIQWLTTEGERSNFLTYFLVGFFLFSWIWFGNFVFKNLITGVVVNNFLAHSNEVRWGENEASVEQELKNIANEIEEEVKRVEIVPNLNAQGLQSESSVASSENSYDDDNLIERYERQAEFWRENYYKPWRYPCMVRLFPTMSSKIERFVYRLNARREAKAQNDGDKTIDLDTDASADTIDILNRLTKNNRSVR